MISRCRANQSLCLQIWILEWFCTGSWQTVSHSVQTGSLDLELLKMYQVDWYIYTDTTVALPAMSPSNFCVRKCLRFQQMAQQAIADSFPLLAALLLQQRQFPACSDTGQCFVERGTIQTPWKISTAILRSFNGVNCPLAALTTALVMELFHNFLSNFSTSHSCIGVLNIFNRKNYILFIAVIHLKNKSTITPPTAAAGTNGMAGNAQGCKMVTVTRPSTTSAPPSLLQSRASFRFCICASAFLNISFIYWHSISYSTLVNCIQSRDPSIG